MEKESEIENLLSKIQKDVPLAPLTTFKIGGPAKYFIECQTKEQIIKALKAARKADLPFFVLGGGSKLLVSDQGFEGLVIRLQVTGYRLQGNIIFSGAGTKLGDLVTRSLKQGLTGLEWAAGIPGTLGGAVVQNAGAFGRSMADIVKSVEVLKIKNQRSKVKNFDNKDCDFGYRTSVFKQNPNLIILSAKLELEKGDRTEIESKINQHLEYRKNRHPLDFPCAGCIFKNQKSKVKNQKLLKEFPDLKKFNKKGLIPAGYLIDKAGLGGKKIGGAQISKKHANFIINTGNATAQDVIRLIELVKKKVKDKFGIELEEEVQFLPYDQ